MSDVPASQPTGDIENASTTGGIPVAPSLGPALLAADVPKRANLVDTRTVYISLLAIAVGLVGAFTAQLLILLIKLITNLSFHGRFSVASINYPLPHPSAWVIFIPVIGAVLIGLMARYGSRAVAGHGIPEAMEQVLMNQSKIPPKMTFLKPISAAISIGTGAPYGAEGPIIATGGAFGSLLGQLLSVTADERKTLLAAGAAAGIAAAFNAPIAAVLLAVELLLFEFRPRSLIPVSLACVIAAAIHVMFEGAEPFFHFGTNTIPPATPGAVGAYVLIGLVTGVGAVVLTRTVYAIEHFFEHLPIHWMWHPAIGAIAVGVIGYYVPETFGSGYYNINHLLEHSLPLKVIALLGVMKFLSWTISLGSGTAGGTLAPVFTIGGALGAIIGIAFVRIFPHAPINIGMAALVGMVAIFAGASRALLTSVVFAVETTLEPGSIIPSLAGCAAAYLVSCLLMRHSIMTVKMAKNGVMVPQEYVADFLDQVLVRESMATPVVNLKASDTVAQFRAWVAGHGPGTRHQGYPVTNSDGHLIGVLTRRDLLDPETRDDSRLEKLIKRRPSVVYDDCTLRDAADHMVQHDIGRLPVVSRVEPSKIVGMITRSDLLKAHRQRLTDLREEVQTIRLGSFRSINSKGPGRNIFKASNGSASAQSTESGI